MHVAATLTQVTPAVALRALLDAGAPNPGVLMLLGQSAVETAHWRSMWGWNFGNITAVGSQDYQILPHNVLHFRAYDTIAEGATDYVTFLRKRGLVDRAAANDLPGYVALLESECYMGCDGQADPQGVVSTHADYVAYGYGIAAYMRQYADLQPASYFEMPGWYVPFAVAGSLLFTAIAGAYVIRRV